MATLNKLIRDAVKEKEKERKEKTKIAKQEHKTALKIGRYVIKFCKRNALENPFEYIQNKLEDKCKLEGQCDG